MKCHVVDGRARASSDVVAQATLASIIWLKGAMMTKKRRKRTSTEGSEAVLT